MSDAPIRTYVLRGNLSALKDNSLDYSFANNECRLGLWKICVLNVGYEILVEKRVIANVNELVQISSNFVRDHKYNNSVIENYSPSLADFSLKGSKFDKKIIAFDKTWFYVNCAGEKLRLFFSNSLDGESLASMNINIFVTILLQQMK
jgi:hypothetical protein